MRVQLQYPGPPEADGLVRLGVLCWGLGWTYPCFLGCLDSSCLLAMPSRACIFSASAHLRETPAPLWAPNAPRN